MKTYENLYFSIFFHCLLLPLVWYNFPFLLARVTDICDVLCPCPVYRPNLRSREKTPCVRTDQKNRNTLCECLNLKSTFTFQFLCSKIPSLSKSTKRFHGFTATLAVWGGLHWWLTYWYLTEVAGSAIIEISWLAGETTGQTKQRNQSNTYKQYIYTYLKIIIKKTHMINNTQTNQQTNTQTKQQTNQQSNNATNKQTNQPTNQQANQPTNKPE